MKYISEYANLLLEVGVGLQKGQNLNIHTEPYHHEFALLVEKMAYEKGARYVKVDFVHPQSNISRCNYSNEEYLDYVPQYIKDQARSSVEEEWSLLVIGGKENSKISRDLNQKNYGVTVKSKMKYLSDYIKARTTGVCTWCVGNMPTEQWAQSIFGGEANLEAKEKLWNLMIPILRLDTEDPVMSWKENSNQIHRRQEILNNFNIDYLHFEGPGSDLKVYNTQYSKFVGGSQKAAKGHEYTPNMPTEEFFTTPDYRKTTGCIKVTRPVEVLGTQVFGAWFEFEDGRVVNFGAEKNKQQLDAYFEIDDKARYLGEVALVDINSPIFKTNIIFNDILFDENASCHIALGRGIGMAVPEIQEKDADELDKLGCNNSIVHTDFMVGSEKVSVTAYSKSGKKLSVIEKGLFSI